jgi:hypothetical protein
MGGLAIKVFISGAILLGMPVCAKAIELTAPEIALHSVCLNGAAAVMKNHPPKVPAVLDRSPTKELAYWNEIKGSNDASLFLVYISNFKQGMFVEAAVEKYKKNCGDLTALPVEALTCSADMVPDVKAPSRTVSFLPPPKHRLKLPPVRAPGRIVKLRQVVPPHTMPDPRACGGTDFPLNIRCAHDNESHGNAPSASPSTKGN